MASALDSAINQHLFNLKAQSPMGAPLPFDAGAQLPMGMMPPGTCGGPPPMPGGMMPPPGVGTGPPFMPPPGQAAGLAPAPPGAPPALGGGGVLSVLIESLPFRYQLSEADLRDTFRRWGSLQSVQVLRDGAREVGVVAFEDQIDALDAQRQLHGHTCAFDGAQGVLQVVRGGPEQLGALVGRPPAFQAAPAAPLTGPAGGAPAPAGATAGAAPGRAPPGAGTPPGLAAGGPPPVQPQAPQPQQLTGPPQAGGPGLPGQLPGQQGPPPGAGPGVAGWPAPANGGARPPWCCKVVIQAELLHPEFPTAGKVVGANGANIEHLRSQNGCQVMLRGRGSQHKEADGQELPEPMFLWIAGDSQQNGRACLEMAQDLLTSVYEEHQQWCAHNGVPNKLTSATPVTIENPDVIPGPQAAPMAAPGGQGPGPGGPPAAGTAPTMGAPAMGPPPLAGTMPTGGPMATGPMGTAPAAMGAAPGMPPGMPPGMSPGMPAGMMPPGMAMGMPPAPGQAPMAGGYGPCGGAPGLARSGGPYGGPCGLAPGGKGPPNI